MKVLKFEIWGDYAHFRKPYTTTSPLTFPFPPRTAIAGIIGAIVGKPKYDISCQNEASNIAISLSSSNPTKKVRVGQNLTQVPNINDLKRGFYDLKKTANKLNQIRYEFLKDPKYIIYFNHNDEGIYDSLKDHLENHTSVYTPYLGISELIANFKFIGEFNIEEKQPNETLLNINSVASKKFLKENSIDFDGNGEYFNIRMPNRLNEERIVQEYVEILFERNGKPVRAIPNKYWQVESGENIIFL